MENDISVNALLNNGIAVGVMWYVLFRINPILKDLTDAINKLGNEIDKRFDKLEERERDTQAQVRELKNQIDYIMKGDSHATTNR